MLDNKYIKTIFVPIVTILTLIIVLLFSQYTDVLDTAMSKMERTKNDDVLSFSKNIENHIKKMRMDFILNPLKMTQNESKKLSHMLSLFAGSQYPYIYILTKDEQGKFRYLADGSSKKDQRGMFLQKFDPESRYWQDSWKNAKPIWKTQKNIDGLWVTYLYPISLEHKTKMLIAFDFSAHERDLIQKLFLPIQNYLFTISALLCVFLVLIYIFGYLLYKQRTKLHKDSLTGLYNRHYLTYIFNNINLEKVSVAVIDLDHFKRINDTYGHNVGDVVLETFSQRLQSNIKKGDIAIRYGGEEFLLFLKKEDKETNHEKLIKKIQTKLSSVPIMIENSSIHLTISIGFNPNPHLNRSLNNAIDIADKMLYIAKTSGRNRVEIYQDDDKKKIEVFGPNEIIKAMSEERLVAFYQPIEDSSSGKILKYESLVRLINKKNEIVPPFKFLPNIKNNTAYRAMSKFMLENAFTMIHIHDVEISVNFDIGDFLDETLYEIIADVVSKNNSLASKLYIELLEDQEITDFSKIQKDIEKLKRLGVRISIDDFGTGYSTFSYLLALDPDIVKIDGFLIKQLATSKQAQDITICIVDLCKKLDIKVVAEFIENDKIKAKAIKIGIDYLQGYAIGKPAPMIS